MCQPPPITHGGVAPHHCGMKGLKGRVMDDVNEDFSSLDDTALLSRRAEMRDALELLPLNSVGHAALAALYDQSTIEVNARARRAWSQQILGERTMHEPVTAAAAVSQLPANAARMLAVE